MGFCKLEDGVGSSSGTCVLSVRFIQHFNHLTYIKYSRIKSRKTILPDNYPL